MKPKIKAKLQKILLTWPCFRSTRWCSPVVSHRDRTTEQTSSNDLTQIFSKIISRSIVSTSKLDQTSNLEGKISPVLQNTPPGTPRVSKNSQKKFTNKSVEFLRKISFKIEIMLKKTQKKFKCFSVFQNFWSLGPI